MSLKSLSDDYLLKYADKNFFFRVSEAERLLRANSFTTDLHSSFSETDQLPFAHSLLANILKYFIDIPLSEVLKFCCLRESGKFTEAARQYQKSIIVAPLLWSNVKNYCDFGGQNITPAYVKSIFVVSYLILGV